MQPTLESPQKEFVIPPNDPSLLFDVKFQDRAVEQIPLILKEKGTCLLDAPTGCGKAFISARVLKAVIQTLPNDRPYKAIFVTTKRGVIQHQRVFAKYGIKASEVLVLGHGALRSSKGELFLTWKTELVNGQESLRAVWDEDFMPYLLVVDESHKLKNSSSLLSKAVAGFSETKNTLADTRFMTLFCSATPGQIVADMQVFACSTRIPVKLMHTETLLDHKTWGLFCRSIGIYNPEEINQAAMSRLRKVLDPYIYKISGREIRFKYKSHNNVQFINFPTQEKAAAYARAWAEFLEDLWRTQQRTIGAQAGIMVAVNKFKQKAAFLRADLVAQAAFEMSQKDNKQIIIGFENFDAIDLVWATLLNLGVPKERIVEISGRLSDKQNQDNIDLYQEGDADFCIVSSKSGGSTLSLHHDRQNGKSRPRAVFIPPPWSSIELVQFLGRGHRFTSQSQTEQYIMGFNGTIEVEVLNRCMARLRSMSAFSSRPNDLADLYTDATNLRAPLPKLPSSQEDDEDSEINEDEVETMLENLVL